MSSLPLLIHPTEEKMSTIIADIHSTHLEVIFSFIFTGTIPFTEVSNELEKSFSAMAIDLSKICLEGDKTGKNESIDFAKPMRRKLKVRLNKLDRSVYFPSKNLVSEKVPLPPANYSVPYFFYRKMSLQLRNAGWIPRLLNLSRSLLLSLLAARSLPNPSRLSC